MFGQYVRCITARWPAPRPSATGGLRPWPASVSNCGAPQARQNLLGLIQAYGYAGSSAPGPWVLSIVGIPDHRRAVLRRGGAGHRIDHQFQVTVTYIIAISLILTGLFLAVHALHSADRLFRASPRDHPHQLPRRGTGRHGDVGRTGIAILFLFPEQSLLFRLMAVAGFVIMSNIWIAAIFLSGDEALPRDRMACVRRLFAHGDRSRWRLRGLGAGGLLIGFVIGQALHPGMMSLILRNYRRIASSRSNSSIATRCTWRWWIGVVLQPRRVGGHVHGLGTGATSQNVIGPFRASVIYDMPVFLPTCRSSPAWRFGSSWCAWRPISSSNYYDAFYNAVRSGGSLENIEGVPQRHGPRP